MSDRTWDATYQTKGVVQIDVLPTVREAAQVLAERQARTVLDMCCGTGRHTVFLSRHGFCVHGLDSSPKAIEITRQRVAEEDLPDVSLSVGDMRKTGLPGNAYDAVVCVWSTGHGTRADFIATIREMFRVLKPGGVLLADFPSTEDPNFGRGIAIEEKTFLHPYLDHSDTPHYYTTDAELHDLIGGFAHSIKIRTVDYPCEKYKIVMKAYWVEAERA